MSEDERAKLVAALRRPGAVECIRDRLRILKMQQGISFEDLQRDIPLLVARANPSLPKVVISSRQTLYDFLRLKRPSTPRLPYLLQFHAYLMACDPGYRSLQDASALMDQMGHVFAQWRHGHGVQVKSPAQFSGTLVRARAPVTRIKRVLEGDERDFDEAIAYCFHRTVSDAYLLAYRFHVGGRGWPADLDLAIGFLAAGPDPNEAMLILRDWKWGRVYSYKVTQGTDTTFQLSGLALRPANAYYNQPSALNRPTEIVASKINKILKNIEIGKELWSDQQ